MPTDAVSTEEQYPDKDMLVRRKLGLTYGLSLLIVVLMIVASGAGLALGERVYGSGEVMRGLKTSDAVNLVVGVPVLLVSMWLAKRGSLIGLLAWPGALFSVTYAYFPFIIAVPFSAVWIVYLAIVPLSAYTMIGLVASIDGGAVMSRLHGRAPARAAGGILIFLGVFVVLRQVGLMVDALIHPRTISIVEDLALWITDTVVAAPAVIVGGVMLWQRKALGYVAGPGLLLMYGSLSVGLVIVLAAADLLAGDPLSWDAIITVGLMAAVCLVPFGLFARAAR